MEDRKIWYPKEEDFLRRNYRELGAEECAKRIGRSVGAVRCRAWRLGIEGKQPGIKWTPQMEKLVRDFFPTMFTKALAKWIGVSPRSVIRKARELGVEKVPGFLELRREDISRMSGAKSANRHSFRKGSDVGKEYRFKKGHQMTPEEKTKQSESMKKYWARRKKMEALGLDWRR